MMTDREIQRLLEAFYDGETTQTEEKELGAFFLGDDVPERWRAQQRTFAALRAVSGIPVPGDLAARLERQVDTLAASGERSRRTRRRVYWSSGIAAALLLGIGILLNPARPDAGTRLAAGDTFSDPAEAAAVTAEALTFMAVQLNKGFEQMARAGEEMEKVNEIVQKTVKKTAL